MFCRAFVVSVAAFSTLSFFSEVFPAEFNDDRTCSKRLGQRTRAMDLSEERAREAFRELRRVAPDHVSKVRAALIDAKKMLDDRRIEKDGTILLGRGLQILEAGRIPWEKALEELLDTRYPEMRYLFERERKDNDSPLSFYLDIARRELSVRNYDSQSTWDTYEFWYDGETWRPLDAHVGTLLLTHLTPIDRAYSEISKAFEVVSQRRSELRTCIEGIYDASERSFLSNRLHKRVHQAERRYNVASDEEFCFGGRLRVLCTHKGAR